MRKYSALYNKSSGEWSVIATDDYDGYWFVFIPDAGREDTAKQTADALNNIEN